MSSSVGLLFLLGGVALFAMAIVLMAARERVTRTPKQTVAGFERSRMALNKIHREQAALRDSYRARARAMHPAGRRTRARRSA